jgi:N-acetylglucosamine kinase-like BadF-type ATPase
VAGSFYLGLDSGGTKTEVAVLAADGAVVTQQIAGPIRLTARRASATVIRRTNEVIDFALGQAGLKWSDIAGFGFGMCGADYFDEIPTQRGTLFKGLGIDPARSELVNDGVVALWGGSAKKRAVILQLGTAFTAAYRTDFGGETPFDHLNAGISIEIRKAVLSASARVLDGRLPDSILPALLLEHFGEKSATDIMRKFVRGRLDTWKMLTVITPWGEAVRRRDPVALQIVDRAAEVYGDDLIHMVRLAGGGGVDVVLGGGLLNHGPKLLRDRIAARVRTVHPNVTIHQPHLSPAIGAAVMAAFLAGAKPTTVFTNARRSLKG